MTDHTDRQTVQVSLGERSYEIVIVSDGFDEFASTLQQWCERRPYGPKSPGKALIVTDSNVVQTVVPKIIDSLSDVGWSGETLELEPGEGSKSLGVVSAIYDHLVEMKAGRQTVVIAAGGGVVGDTAGFAAASYVRGIPFVQVPTTLLAQVDSSVGGKVGVNHPLGKNLIGAFHQPLGVFIETGTLETLPERDYRSGLAEVIKYGVILDAEFFGYLESRSAAINAREPEVLREVISRCCRLKADVVEQDEFEHSGLRAVLNYGHTFAHAFEAMIGYGELMHGEAVSIGMVYAARLALRRKLIDAEIVERQNTLIRAFGLPETLPQSTTLNPDDVIERMRLDKKSVSGKLRFILPTRLGHVELFSDVPECDVRAVLAE